MLSSAPTVLQTCGGKQTVNKNYKQYYTEGEMGVQLSLVYMYVCECGWDRGDRNVFPKKVTSVLRPKESFR